jgi:tRNA (cytidine/uridine-2'-O-)-methyltransferase
MLNVVLIEPEIPPNTGNIGRLCLATGAHLHLVKPLGFSIDDRTLKRAGLDYWKDVQVTLWESFGELQAAQPRARASFSHDEDAARLLGSGFSRRRLPGLWPRNQRAAEPLLAAHRDELLTIPMQPATRSLNLATAVGIVLYEAVRQLRHSGAG